MTTVALTTITTTDHHHLLPTITIIVSTQANIIHLIIHIMAAMDITNRTIHLTAVVLIQSME